jgi:hypothetical protein
MTNEQINIAIAEYMGWADIKKFPSESFREPEGFNRNMCCRRAIPDYCSDLNAMHDVELKCILIDSILTDRYSHNLYDASDLPSFSSTARQRAEAFLKTIGKWDQK